MRRFKAIVIHYGFLVEKQGPPSPDLGSSESSSEEDMPRKRRIEAEDPEFTDDDDRDDEGDDRGSRDDASQPSEQGTPPPFPRTPPSTGATKRKQRNRRFKGQPAHARYRQRHQQTPTPNRRRSQSQCHCVQSPSLLQQFKSATPSDREKLIVLRKVARVSGIFSAEKMCFVHAKTLSSYLGLYTRQFTYPDLLGRLSYASRQLDRWEEFVKEKPDWFTPRAFEERVIRSSFRFDVDPPLPRIAKYTESGFDLADICARIYGNEDETGNETGKQRMEEFESTGNVVLPQLFGCLNDGIAHIEGVASLSRMLGQPVVSLMQLVHLEFDMFDYHYTPAVSRPRLGWSRNMFQSLTQQLVRQDATMPPTWQFARTMHGG